MMADHYSWLPGNVETVSLALAKAQALDGPDNPYSLEAFYGWRAYVAYGHEMGVRVADAIDRSDPEESGSTWGVEAWATGAPDNGPGGTNYLNTAGLPNLQFLDVYLAVEFPDATDWDIYRSEWFSWRDQWAKVDGVKDLPEPGFCWEAE